VQTEIDGVLIGGASLSMEEFEAILTAVYQQTASD
jgi:triosephosphate isomerase